MGNKVETIYEKLFNADFSHQYEGIRINEHCYLAVNTEKKICFITKSFDNNTFKFQTNALSLTLNRSCEIFADNDTYKKKCHILICNSDNKSIIESFITLCLALVKHLNTQASSEEILSFFHSLQQLLKINPRLNSIEEQKGLWGELFLIKESGYNKELINAWHEKPYYKFDFSFSNYKLEVKTTTKEFRVHSFSHEQLYREDDIDIYLCSLMLDEDNEGLSLKELVNQMRVQLSDDYNFLLKLEKSTRELGIFDLYNEYPGVKFDEELARQKIAYFNVKDVPRFEQLEPNGVSSTRYSIDLSTANQLNLDDIVN